MLHLIFKELRMTVSSVTGSPDGERFNEVLALIHSSRHKAMQAVNTQLIELYWQVGASCFGLRLGLGRVVESLRSFCRS